MEGQERVDHQCDTKGDEVPRRLTVSSLGDEVNLDEERKHVEGEKYKYVSDNDGQVIRKSW